MSGFCPGLSGVCPAGKPQKPSSFWPYLFYLAYPTTRVGGSLQGATCRSVWIKGSWFWESFTYAMALTPAIGRQASGFRLAHGRQLPV
jgi:hypothetical protein